MRSGLPADPVGVLLLTDDLAEAEARAAELRAEVPELEPTVLAPDEVANVEPALSPGWAAVRLNTGYPVTPDAATLAMAARAARAGATLRIGVAARPWIAGRTGPRGGPRGRHHDVQARPVLVAGGPWTPEILGMEPPWPPITRTWGVTVQVAIANPPRHILEEGVVHTVNIPTGKDGSLFSLMPVGTVATVGSTFLTDPPDPEVEGRLLVARGAAFVPALADAPILGIRMCARPQSSDGRPRIGPVPGADGLFVCAGHGPWGISTGPGSAALIVDLILRTRRPDSRGARGLALVGGPHRVAGAVEERARPPRHALEAAVEHGQDLALEIPHGGLALGLVVIVAHQVEGAVDGEQRHLLGHAPIALGRLADGLVEIDHHVAQDEWRRRRRSSATRRPGGSGRCPPSIRATGMTGRRSAPARPCGRSSGGSSPRRR